MAQEPSNTTARAEILELAKIYERSVNDDAVDLLEAHIDRAFTAVMVTGEPVSSYEALAEYWKSLRQRLGEDGTHSTLRTIEEIRFESGTEGNRVAIVRGIAEDRVAAARGAGYDFTTHFTAVMVEREDGWKFLRLQETMNPVENAFVDSYRRKAMVWIAVFAGLMGVVSGFAAGRLFKFRRR